MQPITAKRTRWWQSPLLWGVLVSLGLGAVSLLIDLGGTNVRLGVVITIVGITLTLGIDAYLRVETISRNQAELNSDVRQLTAFATAPPSGRAFVASIVDDWNKIEARGSVIHGKILEELQAHFQSRLAELRSGSVYVGPTGRHKFRAMPLAGFRSVESLSAVNTVYWDSPPGRRYLDHQATAIAAGTLTVKRTLVLRRDELEAADEIVRRQLEAGVNLSIVIREDVVTPDDVARLRDLSLVVDNGGVTGVFLPGDAGETFSIVTDKVDEAKFTLGQIRSYAKPARHYYPDLKGPAVPAPRR